MVYCPEYFGNTLLSFGQKIIDHPRNISRSDVFDDVLKYEFHQ
jgi:hypothetical protein